MKKKRKTKYLKKKTLSIEAIFVFAGLQKMPDTYFHYRKQINILWSWDSFSKFLGQTFFFEFQSRENVYYDIYNYFCLKI